ncbi:MAG: hypothetical protein HY298_20590 [Verrucomicrobia bacterium]|nr:hypothetical protein [Verrucomicrobiota bacterium]
MKTFIVNRFPTLAAVLSGLIWCLASNPAYADTNFISKFDSASEVDSWTFDFGSVTHTNSFDPTMDGNTNALSGAMKVTFGFSTNYLGDNKGAYIIALSAPITNLLDLDSMHLDVKVDSGSATDAFGLNGYFAVAFRANGGWDWRPTIGDNIGANYQVDENGWRHFDAPITFNQDDTNAHHIDFQLYGGPSQNIDGPVTLWIDNLYYTTFSTSTSPPPTMTMTRTIHGLNITASVVGETYQRQDIRTGTGNYSWINPSNGAVTYSFTITNFPAAPTNGFEARLMLVGNHLAPGPFADYNETNVVYLRLYDVGGHYDEELYYKVNADHVSIFSGPLLARLSGPSPLGTWGITVAGTNITMFGPSGTTNAVFGDDVLANFNSYTYVYLGIVPNNDVNVGQSATFSAASVSGATTLLDEHFNLLNKWYKGVAQDPTGVLLIPTNTLAKIVWSQPPNVPYTLHATNRLAAATSWPAAGLTINTVGTNKVVLITTPTNSATFFRLENP